MTAIEWLLEQINPYGLSVHESLFKQALEKEKVQIMNAFIAGDINGVEHMISDDFGMMSPEEYFNSLKEQE
jgi:hypothetical protein